MSRGRWREARPARATAAEAVATTPCPPLVYGETTRATRAHYGIYERQAGELVVLRRRLAETVQAAPSAPLTPLQAQLLATPVCDMVPYIQGRMTKLLGRVREEMIARGISWFPVVFPGDDDFWTADRGTGVNVPWYLMNDDLWDLVNPRAAAWDEDGVLRVLRHEVGHALGYAYELWRRPEWERAFGDFGEPYLEGYEFDGASPDHVLNLHLSAAAGCPHYAQKHPDEDWAETFAVWLELPVEAWRDVYAQAPGALAKLEAVQDMLGARALASGPAVVRAVGAASPWASLRYTPGEYLGEGSWGTGDERRGLLAREARLAHEVALHGLYFEQLAGAPAGAWPAGFAVLQGELRAAARGADGWVLVTWDRAAGRPRVSLDPAPPGAPVLLAVCMHEHAHGVDHPSRPDRYLAGLLAGGIDWRVLDRRLARAMLP